MADAKPLLDGSVRVMKTEVQRLEDKQRAGEPLSPGESSVVANIARVATTIVELQRKVDADLLKAMGDRELKDLVRLAQGELKERAAGN